MIHFIPTELLEDREPIGVCLIGAGGTGSQLLPHLARIHTTLQALGKQGLHVMVYDGDTVSQANLARQLFCAPDVGANKAVLQVSRLNRFYGTNWQAVPDYFTEQTKPKRTYNFYVTCVDSVKTRREVYGLICAEAERHDQPRSLRAYYWLDTGNMEDFGQTVLSTLQAIKQPKSKYETQAELISVLDMFPDMQDDQQNTPSCSLAEAISRQDLFINSAVATHAGGLLWQFLKQGYTTSQGGFINLKTGKTNPIPVKKKTAGTSVPLFC